VLHWEGNKTYLGLFNDLLLPTTVIHGRHDIIQIFALTIATLLCQKYVIVLTNMRQEELPLR
jgi:hypothetical protein